MPTPGSRTSSLQTCKKNDLLLLELPGLWRFGTELGADGCSPTWTGQELADLPQEPCTHPAFLCWLSNQKSLFCIVLI